MCLKNKSEQSSKSTLLLLKRNLVLKRGAFVTIEQNVRHVQNTSKDQVDVVLLLSPRVSQHFHLALLSLYLLCESDGLDSLEQLIVHGLIVFPDLTVQTASETLVVIQ